MSVLYVFAGLMPRFSLRTLFVLMTLIILLIGAFQIFYSIAKQRGDSVFQMYQDESKNLLGLTTAGVST